MRALSAAGTLPPATAPDPGPSGLTVEYSSGIPAYAAGLTSAALTVKGPILSTLDRATPDTVNMAPGYDLFGNSNFVAMHDGTGGGLNLIECPADILVQAESLISSQQRDRSVPFRSDANVK
jgi:hypothetical protein